MKRQTNSKKYSTLGSLWWAMKWTYRIDGRFLFFVFWGIPFAVLTPLAASYVSKAVLDTVGSGAPFAKVALHVSALLLGVLLLELLGSLVRTRGGARRYYPTGVVQT